jgi:hypothetical protein
LSVCASPEAGSPTRPLSPGGVHLGMKAWPVSAWPNEVGPPVAPRRWTGCWSLVARRDKARSRVPGTFGAIVGGGVAVESRDGVSEVGVSLKCEIMMVPEACQ